VPLFFCNQQAIPLSFWRQSTASMNLERAEDEPSVKTRRTTYPDEYKIVREFPRYPLGLSGGNSVQFILGAGLKEPAGDLGHSCIRSETTGLPLHPSPMCRL
jgi:hypothetical protein